MIKELTVANRSNMLSHLPNNPGSVSQGRLRNAVAEKLEFTPNELEKLHISKTQPTTYEQLRTKTQVEFTVSEVQYVKDWLLPLVQGDAIPPSLIPCYDVFFTTPEENAK